MKTALKLANSAAAGAWMSKEMAAMIPVLDLEFKALQQQEDGWFKDLRLSGCDIEVDAIQLKPAKFHGSKDGKTPLTPESGKAWKKADDDGQYLIKGDGSARFVLEFKQDGDNMVEVTIVLSEGKDGAEAKEEAEKYLKLMAVFGYMGLGEAFIAKEKEKLDDVIPPTDAEKLEISSNTLNGKWDSWKVEVAPFFIAALKDKIDEMNDAESGSDKWPIAEDEFQVRKFPGTKGKRNPLGYKAPEKLNFFTQFFWCDWPMWWWLCGGAVLLVLLILILRCATSGGDSDKKDR